MQTVPDSEYEGYDYRHRNSAARAVAYSAPSNNYETTLYDPVKEMDIRPFEGLVIHGRKSSYHLLNAGIFVIWVGIIAADIALMERSVALSPTTTSLPWCYSTTGLPSVLNIVFAQGHGIVTTLYLSRLFVSALEFRRGRPRTWVEMFWIANQNWSGPVSILTTGLKMIKLRVRVSALFILFSSISMVALITPIAFDQAYPIKTLDVQVPVAFTPSLLSPSKLLGIDAYAQLAAGKGSWTTNQSVVDIFNSTTFTPIDGTRNLTSDDLFFSGDVGSMDVPHVPGIRIRGGCHAVTADLPDLNNFSTFSQYCQQQLNMTAPPALSSQTLAPFSLALNVSYCSTAGFDSAAVPSNTTLLAWFTNTTANGMLTGSVRGLVQCEAFTTMGNASVYGRNLTFDNFREDIGLYNVSKAQGGEPIQEPLFGALYALFDGSSGSAVGSAQVIDALGFAETTDADQSLKYVSPSTDALADALWRGTTHMTIAVALLSRDNSVEYLGVEHVPVSGRTRDWPGFIVAMALLAAWLVSLLLSTMALWRKTSLGSSFDSYVAGRLLVQRVDLAEGDISGSLEENERLFEKFVVA